MVLYCMSSRKCIYTGKDASTTDKVIPKEGGDENHNWSNSVPCSKEYKAFKGLRLPTELELEANKVFKKLELAKLDVVLYQKEMLRIQSEIAKPLPKVSKSDTSGTKKVLKSKKEKEIEIAHTEKEIKETNFEEVIIKKKVDW